MKDKIFGVLQRVGRSFMLPIALLPVAGLLLGLGSSLTNETMLTTYHLTGILGPGTILNAILTVMSEAGNIIFANLPVLFAMGVAIGMAKQEKEVAALSAVVAFFIMHASISAMIEINGGAQNLLSGSTANVLGITSLQMGVFGGIIVGLGVAALHNRFYKIEFPQVFSFFGGTRFVPIISSLVFTVVGIVLFFVWPLVQQGIYAVGDLVMRSGYVGTWIYGFMERLLIPFGLHHVFYLPFWQTAVGGTMMVGGQLIEGAQNIFFAQLADPTVTQFSVEATRFMSGKFPLMIFGLPGAALAFYRTARPENRKKVSGLLLSAALTSMLTGITEPLEFTFLFVAPVLYGIHCIFAGLAYMLMHICNVGVGMTFSGGVIDMVLFGILQGNAKTNWIWIVIVGIGYFIVYYFLFSFLIRRFDFKTPGRDNSEEVKLYHRSDVEAKKSKKSRDGDNDGEDTLSVVIAAGLGGMKNISDVDCCATRLRCTVIDGDKVDQNVLRSTGASGVICRGNGIQVIYGPRVSVIKSNLCEYLAHAQEDADGTAIQKKIEHEVMEGRKEDKNTVDESRDSRKGIRSVIIKSPVTGVADRIENAPDEGFAAKMMGDGMVVEPKSAEVVAPADGTVAFVFPSKHAIGFSTSDGIEMLLHIGIDTVKLDGKGFEVFVQDGDTVRAGDLLMKLDIEYIRANAPSLVSPVICTELTENQSVRVIKTGDIKAGEDLFAIDIAE